MTSFSVTFRAISLRAAANIKIAEIFSQNASVNGLGFYFDAMVMNDHYTPVLNEAFPYAIREGNGLRISLVAHDAKLQSTVSFGAVAAEARLKNVRVEYEISGFGIDMAVIKAMLSLSSDLTIELAAQLDEVVTDLLPRMLETPGLPVRKFRVPLGAFSGEIEPATRDRTVCYAMASIAGGRSLRRALDAMPGWALEEIVIAVYARLTPGLGYEAAPSGAQQMKASTWLSTGNGS